MNPTSSSITNDSIKGHDFLQCMYSNGYFPDFLVDKCKAVLLDLCAQIESQKPKDLDALYKLSHHATNQINALEDEFAENGSEIETAARECLAENFEFVAHAYGFVDADIEELIGTRDW